MSKSEQIRMRIDAGYSNRQIADATGYDVNYVRAVRGRYLRPEVEKAWYKSDKGREHNRRNQRNWY